MPHLPYWLQCPDPGCSWRGDRWENLRDHRLKVHKVHPSSSQEPDKCKCVIHNPWPLVDTDDTTLESARKSAISFVEKRAGIFMALREPLAGSPPIGPLDPPSLHPHKHCPRRRLWQRQYCVNVILPCCSRDSFRRLKWGRRRRLYGLARAGCCATLIGLSVGREWTRRLHARRERRCCAHA